MKRIMAMLLLLVMLISALPAFAADYTEILTAELWVAGSGEELLLNPDGTGTLKKNNATFQGTWETDGWYVKFKYYQYGDQIFETYISTDKNENYYLYASEGYVYLYQNSVLESWKKNAEEKRYYLSWNENVPLDFINFKLSNAAVYRAEYEPLTKYSWTLTVKKNTQYLFVVGTVKNPTDSNLWLSNIRAEFILDGKKKYKAEIETTKENTSYSSYIDSGKSQKLFIYTPVPVSALKNTKTAELRFSFYNKLTGTPNFDYEGDYFFGLKLDDSKITAIKKTPAKKKTYYKESAKMPVPTSYVDVRQYGTRSSEKSQRTSNKNGYCYQYSAKYSDGNLKSLFNSYVNALKKDGYKLERLKIRWSSNTNYKVIYGKKWVGTIEYTTYNRMYVYVFKN